MFSVGFVQSKDETDIKCIESYSCAWLVVSFSLWQTNFMASHFKSPAIRLFVQHIIQVNSKETTTSKWKHLLALCAENSPVNSPHKGQWRRALMLSLICAWINVWVNNHEAGDLRRYRARCDVTVMYWSFVGGIYRWLTDSPHKGPQILKTYSFHDSIMPLCFGTSSFQLIEHAVW